MKKAKLLLSVLALVLVAVVIGTSLAACGDTEDKMVKEGFEPCTIAKNVNTTADLTVDDAVSGKTLKVGAIMVGNSSEGYTEAHIEGILAAKSALEAKGATVNVTWEYDVPETEVCATKAKALAAAGNNVVITNSYGHQDHATAAAKAYPNTTFVAMTGDYAGLLQNAEDTTNYVPNLKNAFTNVYQSRYISGYVAGLKLNQLIEDGLLTDANKTADGKIKIGYVGAYPYAEVVSGMTAFYLGIKAAGTTNIEMTVKYTNSWFDFDAENQTAKALIADGCIIIGQHADSEGAPTACQEAFESGTRVYSVGYNVDMLKAAPNAALTSATNTWAVYYTYLFNNAIQGKTIATNWAEGYNKGAVAITAINAKAFKADPSTEVASKVAALQNGTIQVFDTATFTVTNKAANPYATFTADANGKLSSYTIDFSYMNYPANAAPVLVYAGETLEVLKTAGSISYIEESVERSAPYFALIVDGIKVA